ncbi:putative oxidoreductase ORF5 in fasciation locus [Legionella massiliensis]|uniref:Putative oxidoreductase ORF5 in fasciation locus n=1 Tax=Legionella massiliensis TaxID=1034943 RepID=A0A078L273_9GAMM|nr:FAD-binding oxidoreductase [Legionella massiliensis]CDZ78118.1 putative oxidoreductase ORF5 in fasciation locus [Legionella massiliensis]CEE13856.1 putative oxidoreductase ORF5 in fasciation locus [Legionella massiliensis]
MQQTLWSTQQIKQCEKESGQAMLSDEHTLVSYSRDFGKLVQSNPAAACIPQSNEKIQTILAYASQNKLPVTIRGKGLSQSGQALPVAGGLSLHLEQLNQVLDKEPEAIWVETNSSWADLLAVSLKTGQTPKVLPYNCNLSVGGVLSAAGIGASSFKFGPISAHVKALEVILANGKTEIVDEQSPLFKACLSGQGRFAVISKACIKLRPCLKQVRTFFLVYLDKASWLNDLEEIKRKADYIEAFCSPSIQGTKLVTGKRLPFAQWLFAIHASVEYENNPPEFADVFPGVHPWQIIHSQDESIHSYLHRHDPRFEVMKLTGQWDLVHPWYECFMTKSMLSENLDELLAELPIHYVSLLQVVPLANLQQTGFFMLPEVNDVYELMILNPGINPVFVPSCLQVIEALDEKFLKQGGKRYLSGYIGKNLKANYWQKHFGSLYQDWLGLKENYDKQNIFRSFLHSS